jgi:hypothetical protein
MSSTSNTGRPARPAGISPRSCTTPLPSWQDRNSDAGRADPAYRDRGESSCDSGEALCDRICRAIYYRAISEPQVDAPLEAVQRAWAAHVTMQRAVVAVTQEAIRVCGGRAFLKRYPLERYARDARAAALMRPWTRRSRCSRPGGPRVAWTGSGAVPQGCHRTSVGCKKDGAAFLNRLCDFSGASLGSS